MTEYEGLLREWAPLSELFNRLPSKSQVGLFFHDVKITSVDVLPEFIALGTNLGIVYWYDRKSKDLQRLRCENSNSSITVLKVISTVEYMVACGTVDGNISIFQIPKLCPEWIPECLKPKNKQVERYTVSELHKSSISALEWSKNGMKLFSGDKNGVVVLTEIDFYMHLCKSAEILNEAYEVVQLSYYQHNLLISTTYRSIICQKLDKWKISQVGKKDRKVLGRFGGIFHKNGLRASDTVVYCTRPGLRIWVSNTQGCVQKTLLFKELLNKDCAQVPLINPVSESLSRLKPQKEASFGVLLPFGSDYIVTYNSEVVYILDPKEMNVICCISGLRSVLDVATCKDELFVLEEERSLIRISYRPEDVQAVPITPNIANPLSSTFRDMGWSLESSGIISHFIRNSVDGKPSIQTDSSVISAEEALEAPSNISKTTSSDSDSPNYQNKFELYSKIGQRQFEETILFKHHRRKKKKSPMSVSVTSLSSSGSDDKESVCTQPTLMNLSTVGILPDLRSPESIRNDIEYKEKILANVLNFDKVKIGVDEEKQTNEHDSSEQSCDMNKNERSLNDVLIKEIDFKEEIPQAEVSNKDEFCIKPFKHVFPDFDKMKYKMTSTNTPGCMTIPTDWKLSTIKLNNDALESSVGSDESLQEWEIV